MKALVRSHVNPLDAAWTTLKKMGRNPSPPSPPPETANPLPRNQRPPYYPKNMDRFFAETPGTGPELSQRELDEQRRVVEAMYPSLSAQEQREERMFRLRSGEYNSAAHEQRLDE